MPPYLLSLPTELLERILSLLCHDNAQSIQACRQSCRTLNMIIAQSQLVQYLERVALLGMYDPLLPLDASASATLELPNRTAALRSWEKAWNELEGGHDGDARVFWKERGPDLRIALPPSRPSSSSSSSAQVRYLEATIIDPDPQVGPVEREDGRWQHGIFNGIGPFLFGPWFIAVMREGIGVRASYSYLDLHGYLDGARGVGEGEGASGVIQSGKKENGDGGADYDRVSWTCIKVPVSNVVAFGLSIELDLALVISFKAEGLDQEEWVRRSSTHLVVRPLRFRDGTPHPCAKVPTIRFNVTGAPLFYATQAQVLGDYLLFWFETGHGDYSVNNLYLIAWKEGSTTLLREDPVGKYGAFYMISDDVLVLVQLDPPGIELCRISNIKNEAGEDGDGDGGDPNCRGSQTDKPRMDKLCTLLLPPLRQPQDATGARACVISAFCTGEHPGHQMFSHGPWPDYRSAPLGRSQMFRQSTKDSIISIELHINGCEGWSSLFEVIVRCATLLSYADGARAVPTAPTTVTTGTGSPIIGGEGRSASAQAVLGGVNADDDVEGRIDDEGVPWNVWGPRATTVSDSSDHGHVDWRYVLGERRAMIGRDTDQICIHDYNPYRIQRARAAKDLGVHGWEDSHEQGEDEGQWNRDTSHPKVTRRIIESSTIRGGQWFKEDVTTALPHLEIVVDVPWCRAFYMEQDQILLHVGDLDKITGRPNRNNGQRLDGLLLYNMYGTDCST